MTEDLSTPAAMASDQTLRNVLCNWGRTCKVSNMHMERTLSRVKKATPGKGIYAERLLPAGALGEWLRRHVEDYHGNDPRFTTKDRALEAGVPLKVTVSKQRGQALKGGLPAALAYANAKVAEEKASGVAPFTLAQHKARISRYATQYNTIDPAEQEQYVSMARDFRRGKRRRLHDEKEIADIKAQAADDFVQALPGRLIS